MLTWCAGVIPPSAFQALRTQSPEEQRIKTFPQPDEGMAGIYIYYDFHYQLNVDREVYLNGICVGSNTGYTFMYFQVPGNRDYILTSGYNRIYNSATHNKFHFQSGKNYFINQHVKTGSYEARFVIETDELLAKEQIQNCTLVTTNECTKATNHDYLEEFPEMENVLQPIVVSDPTQMSFDEADIAAHPAQSMTASQNSELQLNSPYYCCVQQAAGSEDRFVTPQESLVKTFPTPKPGFAGVYIYRSDGWFRSLYLNGVCVGEPLRGEFLYMQLPANKSYVFSTPDEFTFESVKLHLKDGQNYFIEQDSAIGIFREGAELIVPEDEDELNDLKEDILQGHLVTANVCYGYAYFDYLEDYPEMASEPIPAFSKNPLFTHIKDESATDAAKEQAEAAKDPNSTLYRSGIPTMPGMEKDKEQSQQPHSQGQSEPSQL